MRRLGCAAAVLVGLAGFGSASYAQELSIRDVQYTTDPNGVSAHDGEVVDCRGGVCVGKFAGTRPRLILQDPAYPNGWGGIQVKDWTAGDLFDHVSLGDWVALRNVLVEEHRGTTFLQWQAAYNPEYTVVSQGNPLPPPLPMSAIEIPAPVCDPNDPNDPNYGCYVESRDVERYESMRVIVRDVTVSELNLGKALDNYSLQDAQGGSCWATDYMNEEVGPSGYHPFVSVGQHFCGVSGVFEQYTNLDNNWDYYQLATLRSADLAVCGDVDHDGDVDLADLGQLLPNYGVTVSYEGGDLDYDGDVDLSDLAALLGAYGWALP